MSRERILAIAATVTILFFMSLGTVLSKLALSNVSPWTFVAVSVLIAMITMTLYTFVIRRERIPRGLSRQVWFYIIMIGLCNFLISRTAQTLALQRLPATTRTARGLNSYVTNFIGFITMGMSADLRSDSFSRNRPPCSRCSARSSPSSDCASFLCRFHRRTNW